MKPLTPRMRIFHGGLLSVGAAIRVASASARPGPPRSSSSWISHLAAVAARRRRLRPSRRAARARASARRRRCGGSAARRGDRRAGRRATSVNAPGYGGATARIEVVDAAAPAATSRSVRPRACGRRSSCRRPMSFGEGARVAGRDRRQRCARARCSAATVTLSNTCSRRCRRAGSAPALLVDDGAGVGAGDHLVQRRAGLASRRAAPPSSSARGRGSSAAASRAC